jgi:hypothetical protein
MITKCAASKLNLQLSNIQSCKLFFFGYPVKAVWFSCSQKLLKFFGLSNILTLSVPDEGFP